MRDLIIATVYAFLGGVVALTIIAMPAKAEVETYELSSSGNWTVVLQVGEEGNMWCSAQGWSVPGAPGAADDPPNLMSFSVDEDGDYLLTWFVDRVEMQAPVETVDFIMYVGGDKSTFYDTTMLKLNDTGRVMFAFNFGADPNQRPFVSDFMAGDMIKIYFSDGGIAEIWSLKGSATAIRELDKCRQKIMTNV